MTSLLILRREVLEHALKTLPSLHVAVLGRILVAVDPASGCLWVTTEGFGRLCNLSPPLVTHTLGALEAAGLISVNHERRDLLRIELGSIYIRNAEAPHNLPVEHV